MKKTIIMLFVLVIQMHFINAQTTGAGIINKSVWYKIGDVTASFNLDNESIMVMETDKFKAIKLKITYAPITIQAIDIHYESGDVETVILKSLIMAGAETRIIELKSGMSLKKVVFSYKAIANRQEDKVHVELYGLK